MSFELLPCSRDPSSFTEKPSARYDTPSTTCGEPTSEFQVDISSLDIRGESPFRSSHACRDGRGLSYDELLVGTRGPFPFPSESQANASATPVCYICRVQLFGGDLCRELRSCGHCFHGACVEKYFQSRSRCPVCKARCRPSVRSMKRGRDPRPCSKAPRAFERNPRPLWTPAYDHELLSISDKVDEDRRFKLYQLKGTWDSAPQSFVFLKAVLPTLVEESKEAMLRDDGTLDSLVKFLKREKEFRRLSDVRSWNRDMIKLGTAFTLGLWYLYSQQLQFVDLFTKKHKFQQKHFPPSHTEILP